LHGRGEERVLRAAAELLLPIRLLPVLLLPIRLLPKLLL
jgi:hypothetical protein